VLHLTIELRKYLSLDDA
jgi:hypothetical protein